MKEEKKNNIIFFGNINSLANRTACIDFIENYLPTFKIRYPHIEYKIFGNCSTLLKFYFKIKGIKIKSNISSLKNYCKNSLAGICNVEIQSGLQNKILEYSGKGLPVIINKNSNNFQYLKGRNLLTYRTKSEFFLKIDKLTSNVNFRNRISKINFNRTRKYYNWKKY